MDGYYVLMAKLLFAASIHVPTCWLTARGGTDKEGCDMAGWMAGLKALTRLASRWVNRRHGGCTRCEVLGLEISLCHAKLDRYGLELRQS
jgi:hypothetical protein